MLPIKDDDIRRWRVELDQAEAFRDKEFGTYRHGLNHDQTRGVGKNLDYYEFGSSRPDGEARASLNIAFVLTKSIVPLLFPQNPKILAFPKRKKDSQSAPMAAELLNHYIRLVNLKETDQQAVFDSWVLGYGVTKTGYTTEFGVDILPTEKEEKKRLRDKVKDRTREFLEAQGLVSPKPNGQDDRPLVDANEFITKENPYVRWVDPFNFLIDPRARSIHDAWWVAETVRRTLFEIKKNPRFSAAKTQLKAAPLIDTDIPEAQIERFQTADLHEIHYKDEESPTGMTILVLAVTQNQVKPLYHEHSVYKMRGWQYDLLAFNKHNHKLYPVAELSVVRPLLDRLNNTFEAILEQTDKFVAKIFMSKDAAEPETENQLKSGVIGGLVYVKGNPRDVVHDIRFDQVKRDMVELIERVLDFVILTTGLTRAQLTGLTTAQTATEAQIGQGGSTNRRTDQQDAVIDWSNQQVEKLWSVIAQFVDLEQVQLITGETTFNEETGLPNFNWFPDIGEDMSDQLRNGNFRFMTEVTSLQRPNLEILRKQVENFVVALANPAIHQQLAAQGKMYDVAEGLRIWHKLYPELISDVDRLIRPLTPEVGQMLNTPGEQRGGDQTQPGVSNRQTQPPNTADIASAAGGERGQGFPIA